MSLFFNYYILVINTTRFITFIHHVIHNYTPTHNIYKLYHSIEIKLNYNIVYMHNFRSCSQMG